MLSRIASAAHLRYQAIRILAPGGTTTYHVGVTHRSRTDDLVSFAFRCSQRNTSHQSVLVHPHATFIQTTILRYSSYIKDRPMLHEVFRICRPTTNSARLRPAGPRPSPTAGHVLTAEPPAGDMAHRIDAVLGTMYGQGDSLRIHRGTARAECTARRP
ncbi:hypothetical protein FA95DRAFT_1214358 [Auriscalpium vulgare]|uniref:Uncharacterized protein n=1 Tax=Auriscalpium vulgare TaxID=40419 RepID=A0ACB8RUR5_9AGAM|nr:hypothetical protein FA95DRAFT_1214358 [Auriscalpium vulgare]